MDSALQEAKTDNNEMIAKWMGLIPVLVRYLPWQEKKIYWCVDPKGYGVTSDSLAYDSDPSWLLTVVERIDSIGYKVIMGDFTTILDRDTEGTIYYKTSHGERKRDHAYKACVEFIKWHQQQSNAKDARELMISNQT